MAAGQALLVQVGVEDGLKHVPVLGVLGDQRRELGDPGSGVGCYLVPPHQLGRRRNLAGGQDQPPGRSCLTASLTGQGLVVDRSGVQGPS